MSAILDIITPLYNKYMYEPTLDLIQMAATLPGVTSSFKHI